METKKFKNTQQGQNKMGTQPVGGLLFGMSVPLVISMLVQALYNVVDSYFVSNMELIGNKALNAISLAYPIQMLMVAFSVGTGVGMNAYISRSLGMGDHEKADRGAANGMLLMLLTSLVFTAFGFFIEPFFKLFTDDPEILELGTDYLSICMIFCLGIFIQIGGERILQGMGKNNLSMIAQLVGAVTNIVLDPMLIYGIGFFPELGMRGAAIATVIGQWLGMAIAVLLVVCGRHEVTLKLKNFRPDKKTVAEIYRVGAPSIIMQSIGSVMTVGLNAIFSRVLAGETGVSITGIYFKIQSIIFMPVFGITNAAMSIMAFNYGAANRKRLMRTLKLTIIASVLIMLAGVLLFELLPEKIVALFDNDGSLTEPGAHAFRIICLHFPIAALGISISTFFQSLGKGFHSMVMSILRQLGVLLPAALILALVFRDVDAVWWCFFMAELASVIYGGIVYKRLWKKEVSLIPEGAD